MSTKRGRGQRRSRRRAETGRPATNSTKPTTVDLNAAERTGGVTGKGFAPGVSGNPGGQSKEKREFLERLRGDDADTVYASFMALVRDGNPPAVLRAIEYLAGKPKESVELSGKVSAAIEHDIKAEVIQSPARMKTIVEVLRRAGQSVENTETAGPVETKE